MSSNKPDNSTFTAKLVRQKTIVYDLRLPGFNGVVEFFILEVEPSKRKNFLRDREAGKIKRLTDYGTILHSGDGEPSPELKAELTEKYGMYEE